MSLLAVLCWLNEAVSGQVVNLHVPGACDAATEVVLTGSTTNTSAASTCGLNACSFDLATDLLSCTLRFDFGGGGETVVAGHIHWKAFSFAGANVPSGKFVFPVVPGRVSDAVTVTGAAVPAGMAQAFRANPQLGGGLLYVNVHGTWAPPSPMGSVGGWVTGDAIPIALSGACDAAMERVITGSTTNTSASSSCGVSACSYNVPANQLTCSLSYDFGTTGETISAVHIHWKSFVLGGVAFPAEKVVLPVTAGTASGTASVAALTPPANMTSAIRANAVLAGNSFYVNFHSNWSPPSPMGALGGWITSPNPAAAAATTAGSTTASGGTTAPVPGGGACVFGALPLPPLYSEFTITLRYDFATFDCSAFPPLLAREMGVPTTDLIFLSCVPGSVVLRSAAPSASVLALQNLVASGSATLPISLFTSGTTSVAPPGGPPAAVIGGIIAGVLLLLVLAVVALLLWRRHKTKTKPVLTSANFAASDHRYTPLEEAGMRKSPRAPSDTGLGVAAPQQRMLTMQLLTDVVDKGDNILQARRGEIAFVTAEDWEAQGEWVYGKVGHKTGYLPRNYLHKK